MGGGRSSEQELRLTLTDRAGLVEVVLQRGGCGIRTGKSFASDRPCRPYSAPARDSADGVCEMIDRAPIDRPHAPRRTRYRQPRPTTWVGLRRSATLSRKSAGCRKPVTASIATNELTALHPRQKVAAVRQVGVSRLRTSASQLSPEQVIVTTCPHRIPAGIPTHLRQRPGPDVACSANVIIAPKRVDPFLARILYEIWNQCSP